MRSRAEVIMATSAPASSTLSTSVSVWTPVEAASDTRWRRYRMAIQRSGRRSSTELLNSRAGSTSMASMSRSGW